MKKLFVLLLIVALGFLTYFYFNSQKGDSPANQNTLQNTNFTLFREFGEVYYTIPGQKEVALNDETEEAGIISGTKVRTDAGAAYVLFPDNSMMSIDSNTDITINYTSDKVSILQTLGNTYHRVKTLESGQAYEVETPGTLAAVRGTRFAVLLDGQTTIKVTESRVNVANTTTGETKDVSTGSQADVTSDSTTIRTMTEADIRDNGWMEKNGLIDEMTTDPATRRQFIKNFIEGMHQTGNRGGLDILRNMRDRQSSPTTNRNNDTSQSDNQKNQTEDRQSTNPERDEDNKTEEPKKEVIKPTINFDRLLEYWKTSNGDIDRLYQYSFSSSSTLLCLYINTMTLEQLRSEINIIESQSGKISNKESIFEFFVSLETFCKTADDSNSQG